MTRGTSLMIHSAERKHLFKFTLRSRVTTTTAELQISGSKKKAGHL